VHDLIAITALGGTEPRVDKLAGVTCTEVTNQALASVAARLGKETGCASALQSLLKATPPLAGKAYLGTPFSAIWTGPDQWLVAADFDSFEDIEAQVKSSLGDNASVTEQSDTWCGFDLAGDGIRPVMELLCNVNIRAMQHGDATRTSIHHLGCFVICADAQGFIRILGPRASAGSLHHAILTAMKSAL